MLKANDAPHKDATHGPHLTFQEEQVASVKNTKQKRWLISKTNGAPLKDVTCIPYLTF
jgi:hypothetical protein